MEDIVAVRVALQSGEARFFITWGRIQDAVDPTELEEIVLAKCDRVALGGKAVSAHLCHSLQEARDAPYFFEALFTVGQTKIPFGDSYQAWRESIDEQMRDGRQLFFLGSA